MRIHSGGGTSPPGVVRVDERARRVRIRLTERLQPSFTDDGTGIAYALMLIPRCVDITLRRPLGDRVVVDATTGRPVRRVENRRRGVDWRCRLSRPRG